MFAGSQGSLAEKQPYQVFHNFKLYLARLGLVSNRLGMVRLGMVRLGIVKLGMLF